MKPTERPANRAGASTGAVIARWLDWIGSDRARCIVVAVAGDQREWEWLRCVCYYLHVNDTKTRITVYLTSFLLPRIDLGGGRH